KSCRRDAGATLLLLVPKPPIRTSELGRRRGRLAGRGNGNGKVSLARANDHVLAVGLDPNRVVLAVRRGARGTVGQRVLTAELLFDVEKRLSQIIDLVWKESAASGFQGKLLEDSISLLF